MSSNMADAGRVDAVHAAEVVVAAGGGLRHIVGIADVEDALEALQHAELARHPLGMRARAVGEDELAAGQPVDGGGQLGMLAHHRQVEVVHVVEERLAGPSGAPASGRDSVVPNWR